MRTATPDPYEVLGVPVGASKRQIRVQYLKLSKKHHPDMGGDPEQYKKINAAYDTLRRAPENETPTPGKQGSGNTPPPEGGGGGTDWFAEDFSTQPATPPRPAWFTAPVNWFEDFLKETHDKIRATSAKKLFFSAMNVRGWLLTAVGLFLFGAYTEMFVSIMGFDALPLISASVGAVAGTIVAASRMSWRIVAGIAGVVVFVNAFMAPSESSSFIIMPVATLMAGVPVGLAWGATRYYRRNPAGKPYVTPHFEAHWAPGGLFNAASHLQHRYSHIISPTLVGDSWDGAHVVLGDRRVYFFVAEQWDAGTELIAQHVRSLDLEKAGGDRSVFIYVLRDHVKIVMGATAGAGLVATAPIPAGDVTSESMRSIIAQCVGDWTVDGKTTVKKMKRERSATPAPPQCCTQPVT